MLVLGEINHKQQFFSVLGWVWTSCIWDHILHGGAVYSQVHLPFNTEKDGRESICGQFSETALMDLCWQLNPLFVTRNIRPWPRLPGAEVVLLAPAESNWAVLRWTKWASAPPQALGKCKRELTFWLTLQEGIIFIVWVFFPCEVQVSYHGKTSWGV